MGLFSCRSRRSSSSQDAPQAVSLETHLNNIKNAIESENSEKLCDLIKEGNISDINSLFSQFNNKTMLQLACEKGSIHCVKVLLQNGADLKAGGNTGILTSVCISCNIESLNYLFGCGLELTDSSIFATLHNIPTSGDRSEIIAALLSHIKDVNYHDKTASFLQLLSGIGCSRSIRYLLERGADRNAANDNCKGALDIAASRGPFEAVKVLIDYEIGDKIPISKLDDALFESCVSGHLEVVNFLIERGANVNSCNTEGVQVIAYAVDYNKADVVELLLKQGASAHATAMYKDSEPISLLFYACVYGYEAVVRVLLVHGADPNAIGPRGYTPLYFTRDSLVLMDLLIRHGADPNQTSPKGGTVFLNAVKRVCLGRIGTELVVWLLNHGADINLPNIRSGNTALMIAAASGHVDLVKLLLEHRADVTQLNHAGKGVLDRLDQNGGWSWKIRKMRKLCKQYIELNRPPPYEEITLK